MSNGFFLRTSVFFFDDAFHSCFGDDDPSVTTGIDKVEDRHRDIRVRGFKAAQRLGRNKRHIAVENQDFFVFWTYSHNSTAGSGKILGILHDKFYSVKMLHHLLLDSLFLVMDHHRHIVADAQRLFDDEVEHWLARNRMQDFCGG